MGLSPSDASPPLAPLALAEDRDGVMVEAEEEEEELVRMAAASDDVSPAEQFWDWQVGELATEAEGGAAEVA